MPVKDFESCERRKVMKKIIVLLFLICGIVSANAASIFDSYNATMYQLSYNASNQQANDINNAGQVVGTSWDGKYAYLRNLDGSFSYLYAQTAPGVGTHSRTYGNAVSTGGDAITTGSGTITSGNYQPLLYKAPSIVPPTAAYNPLVIGVSTDRANAVSTQYTGGYHVISTKKYATIWDFNGTTVSSYGNGGNNFWYTDVSANNVFVGQVENLGSFVTKYNSGTSSWDSTYYEDPAYGSLTQFNSVNGDGTLFCGYVRNTSTGTYYEADVWGYDGEGNIVRKATLDSSNSATFSVKATAINSTGNLVVGVGKIWGTTEAAWIGVPVVWENVDGTWTAHTFESLLAAEEQGLWKNVVLTGVNDSGSITGYGNYNSQTYLSGFVLQAVPEPATVSLILLGGSTLFVRRKK